MIDVEKCIASIDWLTLVEQDMSIEEIMDTITSKTNLIGNLRKIYNISSYVVPHSFYAYSCALQLVLEGKARISRIDIKFDFDERFDAFFARLGKTEPSKILYESFDVPSTVYYGKRESDIYVRMYDKQLESNLVSPLSRVEFEVKGSVAFEFSKRVRFLGYFDAFMFLYSRLEEYRIRHFYSLQLSDDLDIYNYLPFFTLDNNDYVARFYRFYKQYRKALLLYCHNLKIDNDTFFEIMNTEFSDFKEFSRKVVL